MPATPKKGRRFGGNAAHQRLMMANLAASLFAAEGIVRAMTESGRHAYVATVATALALAALAAILLSFRAEK